MTAVFPRCKRRYQHLVVAASTFNVISLGMTFGWTSPMIPKLLGSDSVIPMTNEESSWVVVSILLGMIMGANMGALLINRIGRKYTSIVSAIPLLTASIIMAFTRNLPMLICARLIAGIGDGSVFATSSIYISEISDPEIRGFFGTSIAFADTVGILLVNIIGSYCSYFTTALIPASGPILLLLIVAWMPESPYYLIMKGKIEEAKRSLQIYRGRNDVDNDLQTLTEAVQQHDLKDRKCPDVYQIVNNRKMISVLLCLFLCKQFTGFSGIMFYAQTIFQESADVLSPVVSSSIYFTFQIVMVIVSATLVDKVGRRPLLIASITGSLFSLLTIGVYFSFYSETYSSWISVVGLFMYVVAFNLGLQSIPLILASELFPTNVKAFVMSFTSIVSSVSGIIASKVFQITKDYFGIQVPFLFFAGCSLLGLVHIIVFIPETKEKTLEAIQAQITSDHAIKKQKNDTEISLHRNHKGTDDWSKKY